MKANKWNKRKLVTLILGLIALLSVTVAGCGGVQSEEERWNSSENVIGVDSVKDEADYSKFDEEDKETEQNSAASAIEGESSKDSQENSKENSKDHIASSTEQPGKTENKVEETKKSLSCTISISCSTILQNMSDLTPGKESLVPSNGVILRSTKVEFDEGDTVFDILQKVTRNKKIHMEYVDTPAYNSAYIEGIANLYEKDCGSGSGWMYCVNGWYPDYGCSQYEVKDGDVIQWNYTCDLGRDL